MCEHTSMADALMVLSIFGPLCIMVGLIVSTTIKTFKPKKF